MSGPESNLKPMWEKIASILNIDEPQPMALYLGCIHDEGSVQIDAEMIRAMTFNQEPFFLDKVERYKELCLEKGGKEVKLSAVITPYLKGPARLNCARKPEFDDEEGVMRKSCRHAFALKQADDVPFSNGRLVHFPWCDVALDR